jgi:hypothetical protein
VLFALAMLALVACPVPALAAGTSRAPQLCLLRKNWAMKVHDHQRRVSSQFGQDGALEYVLSMIGTTNKYYVEYGFNAPSYEGGSGANTFELYKQGWRGLLLDGGFENATINLHKTWISPDTIVDTLRKYDVPKEFDLLSNDLDSADLWVLRSVLSAYSPRVILVEFNCNYPLEATLTNHPSTGWEGNVYGSSMKALSMVADEFGYVILDVIEHDLLLLRRDLLCGSDFQRYESWKPFTRRSMHQRHPFSREQLGTRLVDYAVWKATDGNMTAAQGDAVLVQVDAMQIFSKFNGVAK